MRNRTDINHTHARAICLEIGGRLRGYLGEEPELPPNLKKRVDLLRQLEGPSPSIVPTNENENGGEPPKDANRQDRLPFAWPWRRKSR